MNRAVLIFAIFCIWITSALAFYEPSGHFIPKSEGQMEPQHARLVVFVHGVIGTAESTFTASNGQFWPDLVARDDLFKGMDVFSYSYFTGFLDDSPSIEQLVPAMMEVLSRDARITSYGSVVFVAHSLGGILVRKLLLDYPYIRANVAGVFTLGTPSLGSDVAETLSLLPSKTLKELAGSEDPDGLLNKLVSDYLATKLGQGMFSFCAYETLGWQGGPIKVVKTKEADGICNTGFEPLDGLDHDQIVKPARESSPQHVMLKDKVIKVLFPNEALPHPKVDILLAACSPDKYGVAMRDEMKKQLAPSGASVGETRNLHNDWYPRDRELLFTPGSEPKLLVIHYSCFQELGENPDGRVERQVDFKKLLAELEQTDVKILVYSNGLDRESCNRACFIEFAIGGFEKGYPEDERIFFIPVTSDMMKGVSPIPGFATMVTKALQSPWHR